ncbi:MAG: hypothetical protein H6R25_1413 [Proteobacteria bacterium]|nr:hypothetical protein [Pseudomonadota bacterium]
MSGDFYWLNEPQQWREAQGKVEVLTNGNTDERCLYRSRWPALSISFSTSRLELLGEARLLAALKDTARAISHALGYKEETA